jgi:hypothetical protein
MCPHHEKVVPLRLPTPVGSIQGTLALDLEPLLDPPQPAPAPAGVGGDVVAIEHALRIRLQQWAHRYVQAAVEIVGGDRPASQLLRWTSRPVYDDLARRAHLVALAAGRRPGQGGIQSIRPQVVGVRTSFLAPDVAETSAHVRYGERSRAVALRFEWRADRWQCTALEFA